MIFTWPGKLKAILYDSSAEKFSVGAASSNLSIGEDGFLNLGGTATVWEDISEPLNGDNLFSTPGTADYDWGELCVTLAPNGNIANNSDLVTQVYQLRHATKVDSMLKFHIHWEQKDSTARQFTWKYRKQSCGGAKATAWSSNVVVNSGETTNAFPYTSGTINQITNLGSIDTTGLSLSSVIQVKLTRTDAVAGNINATFIDMHYERDSLGSRTESTK